VVQNRELNADSYEHDNEPSCVRRHGYSHDNKLLPKSGVDNYFITEAPDGPTNYTHSLIILVLNRHITMHKKLVTNNKSGQDILNSDWCSRGF
jgi:hypothetical protein